MKLHIPILTSVLALALALAFAQTGCAPATDSASETTPASDAPLVAVAELQPTAGNDTRGTVTFTQLEGGVEVVVDVTGMTGGAGKRGFHIHETGDCSAPDGTSAGGHFNPTEMAHGGPTDDTRHAGDFGNLEFNADGVAQTTFIDTHISFTGPNSIIGRAVIVHLAEDDLQSQPTGDAGPRAACGVIELVE